MRNLRDGVRLLSDGRAVRRDVLPRLDLSCVQFVDAAGVKLLRDLLDQGVALGACSGLVAELLHVGAVV